MAPARSGQWHHPPARPGRGRQGLRPRGPLPRSKTGSLAGPVNSDDRAESRSARGPDTDDRVIPPRGTQPVGCQSVRCLHEHGRIGLAQQPEVLHVAAVDTASKGRVRRPRSAQQNYCGWPSPRRWACRCLGDDAAAPRLGGNPCTPPWPSSSTYTSSFRRARPCTVCCSGRSLGVPSCRVIPRAASTAPSGYASVWLADRPLKPRTRDLYRRLLDQQILPTLGDHLLVDIPRRSPAAKANGSAVHFPLAVGLA